MRRQGGARVLAAAVLTGLVTAPLAACSVPREADLAAAAPSASAAADGAAGASASPAPTPSETPSPTPSPTSVKPPVPKKVAGYTLRAAPRGLGDPLAAVRGAGDLFAKVTVKSVAQGDTPVGLLFLFAVKPQYVDQPRVSSLVLPKVVDGVTGGGLPVAMQRFGKQRVAVGSSPKKGTIVLWYDAGVLAVVVGGGTPSNVTGYAKAYVTRR
jgi:hypothetical protein